MDAQGDTLNVTRYNLLNLPEECVTASGDTVHYVYSADGEKLYVQENPATGTAKGTEYEANYRMENDVLTMIHTDAGYYTPVMPPAGVTGPVYAHLWYLKDHLGNIRVLADGGGNAVVMHDFDPFGEEIELGSTRLPYPFPPGGTESPYKYGGKEWNMTSSTYDFEARQLSPSFHRFTTMDPLCEKYYSISPYAYCANNPVNMVDPEGKDWVYHLETQQYIWNDNVTSSKNTPEGYEYVGMDNSDILRHAGFLSPIHEDSYEVSGVIYDDLSFVNRALIDGESTVCVSANTSFSKEHVSETNRSGRVFMGLTIVAYEGMNISSTSDDLRPFFQMTVRYNGKEYYSQMRAPNSTIISTKRVTMISQLNIPAQLITKPSFFHNSGMTVSVTGMWGIKSFSGFVPLTSIRPPLTIKTIHHEYTF